MLNSKRRKVISSKRKGLVWLDNNLRLHNNPLIARAAKDCHEIAIVFANFSFPSHSEVCYRSISMGTHRAKFLWQSLADLSCQLDSLKQKLIVFKELNRDDWLEFIRVNQFTDIYTSNSFDYDQRLRQKFTLHEHPEINLHSLNCFTLFDALPMTELPKSFTNFRKAIEKSYHLLEQQDDLTEIRKPEKLPPTLDGLYLPNDKIDNQYQSVSANSNNPFRGGELSALKHLESYFSSDFPAHYKETRNALDDWNSSTKFSAWLANGCLSVTTLLNRLRRYQREIVANNSTYWIWFELLWREYFQWYANAHQAKLFRFKGIHPTNPLTSFYAERFQQWSHGTSSYPLVNAIMNQLTQTGYISNRARQIAASCFVNELCLDWRFGASFFEQHLVDYDVASNWGNWQYLAGVGADPRGGRHFNLKKQTTLFDPEEVYIHQWDGRVKVTATNNLDAADWPINPKA